ncbi:hypothetical protein CCZ37_16615 [Vibrio qinghaiensis]|uniref:DUF2971 domain-containing protein n=1 Tax=Vibrio qinghaiensis TaxID=2025808 RepID=A0A223N2L6_9VIBR|nr:DUF2971 domain-containing protein [Vibrio qinghaiensis]ASU24132.1 hypothetical protein CCZ37_16615 [Vibrio qinghaiensis]
MKNLYKYVTPESIDIILRNSSIKITNPSEFNDPLDCNVPEFEVDSKILKKIFTKNSGVTKHEISDLSSELDKSISELKSELEPLSKELTSAWEELIAQFRVLSLTEDSNNILMWSHYADDHKGAVIGFKKFEGKGFVKNAKRVDYRNGSKKFKEFSSKLFEVLVQYFIKEEQDAHVSNKREKLVVNALTSSTLKFFTSYFFFKKNEWNYEKEHRLVLRCDSSDISQNGGVETISFDTSEVCEIIFGVKADTEVVHSCSLLAKEKYPEVHVYQMEKVGWSLVRKKI